MYCILIRGTYKVHTSDEKLEMQNSDHKFHVKTFSNQLYAVENWLQTKLKKSIWKFLIDSILGMRVYRRDVQMISLKTN